MDFNLRRTLSLLDFSDKEIKFFEASFALGPASINNIANKAGLQRSTSYLIADDLLKKGFLMENFKDYKKTVFTIEPKDLLRIISSKQRLFRRQELQLHEVLPELQSLYSASQIRPRVKVYEGQQGLLNVWNDILATKGELAIWTNQQTDKIVFGTKKHVSFIDERIKKGIAARVLAVDNEEGRLLQSLDSQSLRETRLLPNGVHFSAEMYMYDDKIATLDYNKDVIGVIIESSPITSSQRAIFDMNWQLLA